MAVMAECPYCHRKQATKNKRCVKCSQDLDKAKAGRKINYWICYRAPDKKQKWELIGNRFQRPVMLKASAGLKREKILTSLKSELKPGRPSTSLPSGISALRRSRRWPRILS